MSEPKLTADAKKFLQIWNEFSPYNTKTVRVVNAKQDCRIYFILDGMIGNIGSYEYHLRDGNLSGFETLEDGKQYPLEELI